MVEQIDRLIASCQVLTAALRGSPPCLIRYLLGRGPLWCLFSHESRYSRGRSGNSFGGRDYGETEADGRDRSATGALAHHEDLQPLRLQRLRYLPWLQGLCDQGVL